MVRKKCVENLSDGFGPSDDSANSHKLSFLKSTHDLLFMCYVCEYVCVCVDMCVV